MRRGFVVMAKKACLLLFLGFDHPIFEYTIQTGSPYVSKDSDMVTRLQEPLTRLVEGL